LREESKMNRPWLLVSRLCLVSALANAALAAIGLYRGAPVLGPIACLCFSVTVSALAARRDANSVDEAWLLARERGENASHPDQKRADEYIRLQESIRSLPGRTPPAGWEDRVLKQIEEVDARARKNIAALRLVPGECPRCRGRGQQDVWHGEGTTAVPCDACAGAGKVAARPAPRRRLADRLAKILRKGRGK
jgi:hypothetical protein